MCADVMTGVVGSVAIMRRSVSTRITFRGCFLLSVAETRGFYGAGFFRGSESSAEPVVFSRATHKGSSFQTAGRYQVENEHHR